jgi:hypothetical protein
VLDTLLKTGLVLGLLVGHCFGQTPSKIICYEEDSCPHTFKNGKSVEVIQEPEFTLLVSMQRQFGMVEVEIAIANTSQHELDVIPSQIVGASIQEDSNHPRHTIELAQVSRDHLLRHSYSTSSPLLTWQPPAPQTTTTGQMIVVGPTGRHSVYTYSETAQANSDVSPVQTSQLQTMPTPTPMAFAAANALAANTLSPQQTIHGMVYFRLPVKNTVDAGVLIPLAGKWYEFHFNWPRP